MKSKIFKYFKLSYISLFLSLFATAAGFIFFIIYANGSGKASVQRFVPNYITEGAANIRDTLKDLKYLGHNFPDSNLPLYKLEISKENLKKMESAIPDLVARREKASYVDGVDDRLRDENRVYVPAKFRFNGGKYDVKIRIRGNGPPHWSFPKKSYRIRFPKDNLFNGKRDINLIIPLDRRYIAEQFNNYRARKMGLIVPDSRFVAVEINGQKPALFWEVEHFTKEFIESHNLSGDANLYGEGDTFQQHIYTDENYWQKYAADPSKRKEDYTQISMLLYLLNEAPDDVFYKRIFDILDENNFYNWSIHNLLAGSWHQDYSHNARIYFDKSIGKFIFLPWDVYVYDNYYTTDKIDYALEATANPLVDKLLSNSEIMQKRNALLWKYVSDDNNLKDDLRYYDELFKSVQKVFYHDPIRRYSYDFFAGEVKRTRNDLKKNFNQIKWLFENSEFSFVLSNNNDNNELNLEVATFKTFAPVFVEKIILKYADGSEKIDFDVYKDGKALCLSQNAETELEASAVCDRNDLMPGITKFDKNKNRINNYSFNIFRLEKKKYDFIIKPKKRVDLNDIDKVKLRVINSYTGKKIKDIIGVFVDNTEFADFYDISKTSREFVSENKQFYLNSKSEVVLPAGVYTFNKNVVVPKNTKLHIHAGAIINLISGASFISYSPVIAKGAPENPIMVRGEADGEGENFGVLDNDGLSIFEYVKFFGGGESTVNGAFFSGMLAIHHADSIIRHSVFENAKGDDALNIKYASSTVAYNLFQNNSADAIDYDFSDGVIEHNKFIGNGNDSIDTSGSPVLIRYNNILNSGDKCISSGEKSTSIIFNNVLNGCHIGVEIKDLSEIILINNVIVNNDIGINEYQKKEIFGGGSGKVYNSIIWGNKDSIKLDKVSVIEVKNSDVEGGYKGDNIFSKKPVFTEGWTIDAKNASIKFQNGGIAVDYLNLKSDVVPVGLIYGVF